MKKIHRNFTIPTIFLLFLISCGSKNLSNKIASPRMALNTPIEIDFFLNEESQILKIPEIEKDKIISISKNTCNKKVSIKIEEDHALLRFLPNKKIQSCEINILSKKFQRNLYISTIFINLKIKSYFFTEEVSMLPVLGFSGRSSLFTKNLNFKTQFDAGKHGITYYYQVLYQREFKQGLELIHSRNFANQKSMFSFLLINDSPSPATNSDWWTKNYKSTDKIDSSKEDFISVGICSAKVCENKAGFYVNQALIYYDRDLKSYFAQKFIFSAL